MVVVVGFRNNNIYKKTGDESKSWVGNRQEPQAKTGKGEKYFKGGVNDSAGKRFLSNTYYSALSCAG